MTKLYTEQTVEITAPPHKVWSVLTQSTFTKQWVGAFQPVFAALESDWNINSRVEWKTHEGETLVDGVVTKAEPNKYLSYSVHDVSGKFDDVQSDEDGIFYELSEQDGATMLKVRQGDFGKVGERGQELRDITAESWARVLPIVKRLAEQ